MIKILNSSLKQIGVLNNIFECKVHEVLNSEYTMDFACTIEKLKTELLYNKNNVLELDDDYYQVFKLDELHEINRIITVSGTAEHIGYKLIQKIFEDGFSSAGTVQQIGQQACVGTPFTFMSDIQGYYSVEIDGLCNARQVIDILCAKAGGEVRWHKFNVSILSSIGVNTIRVEFGINCSYIKRHLEFNPDKQTYEVNLLDVSDEATKGLRKAHIGDTVIIRDKALGIERIVKKVIATEDDKIANLAGEITTQGTENFDRTIPNVSMVVLGDKPRTIIDEINKNIEIPKQQTDTLITVIEQEVISAKTAMITNCWINELSVEFLETNFNALDIRKPYPTGGERYFSRIHKERMDFIVQTLSNTEVQDYITPSGLQIYWTAINDAPQAYKFFTITNPIVLNSEVTDIEPFKVKVRKVLTEKVKKSNMFKSTQTASGATVIMPVNIEGEGTSLDKPFGERRGQFIDFKDSDGKTFKQFCENNDEFTGLKFTETGLMQYNQFTKAWTPIAGGVTIGGLGSVKFWKDKTAFDPTLFQNTNVAHFGYSSTDAGAVVGEWSTFFPNAIFLGAEVVTKVPPTVNYKNLYLSGDEFIANTGGWVIANKGANAPSSGFVKAEDHMEVNTVTGAYSNMTIGTDLPFNMTGYINVCFEVSFYKSGTTVYGSAVGISSNGKDLISFVNIPSTTSRIIVKLPINTTANLYTLCSAGADGNRLNIYKVWLEK